MAHGELGERPNIIVDGAPLPSTLLTLSHWPVNQTPAALKRDTSTATAFAWLDTPEFHQDIPWVSNSHFDEDGLFSMFAVTDPVAALARRELLEAGALAGDFGVYGGRAGPRLAFAIETLADPSCSPLPPSVFAAGDRVAALYQALLPRLPGLLAGLDGQPGLWAAQELHLDDSERLLDRGEVTLRELPELDLAVVTIPPALAARRARRYLRSEAAPVHPFAIHNRTGCSRILRVQGRRYEFQYRYETWVQLASRKPPLRRDLRALRDRLNQLETGGACWRLEPADQVAPRLWLREGPDSALDPERFIAELAAALASAPVAWDPFDWRPTDA
jgi:hypothetical protein